MPPTIAATLSTDTTCWITSLAFAGSGPLSRITNSYWYFVSFRSSFAIWNALTNESPNIAYGPSVGTMTPILTTPLAGGTHASLSVETKATTIEARTTSAPVASHAL
jgi:hypothetical protein